MSPIQRASPSSSLGMALLREGSATQFAAVQLWAVSGEERYELAGLMLQLADRVEKAIMACPRDDTPMLTEFWAGTQQVIFLCRDLQEWFDHTRDMPLEACIPEPNLLALTALPPARRGSLPPHVSRARTTVDALRHLVSMPLFYTNHRQFFRNLELLDELASSCTSFGSTLEWPSMTCFGAELSELVSLRRVDTISFSLDPF